MSSNNKKKHKPDSTTRPLSTPEQPAEVVIPSLPNDIALNILAHVPRSYHPVLAAVSKTFRTLLMSPEFFKVRSQLDCAEHLLYGTYDNWFVIYQRPNQINGKNIKSLVKAPVPKVPVSDLKLYACATLGAKIYVMGGEVNGCSSSDVWVLDCRFHTWEQAPSMRMARSKARATVLDGKIFVMGGLVAEDSSRVSYWAEMFDPIARQWDTIPGPVEAQYSKSKVKYCAVVGGRICVWVEGECLRFEPITKRREVFAIERWDVFGIEREWIWDGHACVVEGTLYFFDWIGGWRIKYFDHMKSAWKELKGLRTAIPFERSWVIKLINLGGKLVMMANIFAETGDEKYHSGEENSWYVEIELKKNSENGDMWGEVKWSEKIPCRLPDYMSCISVSL